MLALIKLTLTLPGLSAPKMSWVTLPIAPTGVVSVSPVTRQATSASQKDSVTAIAVSQTGMPKLACPSQASATNETIWPAPNQLIGVSMRSASLAAAERKASSRPRSRNALNAVRQLSAKLNSPAASMQDAPNQSVHCTRAAKPAPSMTPFVSRIGTTTAQHNVPETNMVAQTRIPVMAPAATNMRSQEKTTVRPDQASYWLPRSHFCRFVRRTALEKRSRLVLTID